MDLVGGVYAGVMEMVAESGDWGGAEAAYAVLPKTCMGKKEYDLGEADVVEAVHYQVDLAGCCGGLNGFMACFWKAAVFRYFSD